MTFTAVLELAGKTATGFTVPEAVVFSFNKGKRVPVYVTINGYTYRSTVSFYAGDYMLPVSAENRDGACIKAGDTVEIELKYDDQPREVEVPSELAAALVRNPAAQEAFDKLSYSNKRRHTLSVDGTNNPETKERRVQKAIDELLG